MPWQNAKASPLIAICHEQKSLKVKQLFLLIKNRGMTTNAGGLKEEIALNDIQNVLEEPVK